MSQVSDIQVEAPDAVTEQNLKIAEAVARQAVMIALQQCGELTIREAAASLNLTYEEYLQLLSEDGLDPSRFEQDQSVLQRLRQSLPNHS
jgi:predicted HTH domain antitoxin